MKKQLLTALTLVSLNLEAEAQNRYFVDKDAAGMNDGSTWGNAFTNLQTAIDSAISGDSLFVKGGVYELTASIQMKDSVKIFGSFFGDESSLSERVLGTARTQLIRPDTASGNFGIISNNMSNLNRMTTEAVLDGFEIRGGRTTQGGGIFNNFASPTLRNLIISGNNAAANRAYGGGIYNNNSSPVLVGVTISGNNATGTTEGAGAGIYNSGSDPVLTDVTIIENIASSLGLAYGGGIYNLNSDPEITDADISANTVAGDSEGYGGGMHSNNSNAVLVNVTIRGNSAFAGGGMENINSDPVLTNVIISGNEATGANGGGIDNFSGSDPVLTNVVIAGNSTTANGGGMSNESTSLPVIRNSLVLGNDATTSGDGIFNDGSSGPSLTYSLVQDIAEDTAAHNLDGSLIVAADVFVDPEPGTSAPNTDGDYQLMAGSPVIDMGNDAYFTADSTPALSAITTDLVGNARFNGTIDLGAFEYDVPLPLLLLSFSGRITPAGNELQWETAEENEVNGFEIERAGKDQVFENIGFVTATGKGNYRFMDEAVQAGANYYRLRMHDLDGSFSLSEIIYLNTAGGLPEPLVYPNPFKSLLGLQYAKGDLSLVNMLGQEVYRQQIKSEDVALIDLPTLPQGIYLLRLLRADGTVTVKKLTKE